MQNNILLRETQQTGFYYCCSNSFSDFRFCTSNSSLVLHIRVVHHFKFDMINLHVEV